MADRSLASPTSRHATSSHATRGFTLVELMVVIVILGTLLALVGPNIYNALFRGNEHAARAQMSNFEQALDQYKMVHKKYPSSLQALTETDGRNPHPLLKKIPADPWGTEYEYRLLDRANYEIRSAGEDLEMNTDDDIVWPEVEDS